MQFTAQELRKLALPLIAALVLIGGGVALIIFSQQALVNARRELSTAQSERQQVRQKLDRIAEEEREVKDKLTVYKQLKTLNVIGPERRLDWADSIERLRVQRDLLGLRYRVERQRLLASTPGKPGTVDIYASAMQVDLALLHEGDLLRFLEDLRGSGNAYYSVRSCQMTRTSRDASARGGIAPRVTADCTIDLITIIDRGAKRT